jgi:hypothetical protein
MKEDGVMRRLLICCLIVCALVSSAAAIEKKAYQISDDYGTAPLEDCALQYYYYIPCPTYSWVWYFHGFDVGDVVGKWFEIGDLSTGGFDACDPAECHTLTQVRVLDMGLYGLTYPDQFWSEFDVFCCDEYGCPIGPSLWNSGPVATGRGWQYIYVTPPLSICPCATDPGPPPSAPRILVTVTQIRGCPTWGPWWAADNVSTPVLDGCAMHDLGCLPALYPRPYDSHYGTMHSGYYGQGFEHCPPQWFKDGNDTTPDGSQYGFVELLWRVCLDCTGPTETEGTTWSTIKSMYR